MCNLTTTSIYTEYAHGVQRLETLASTLDATSEHLCRFVHFARPEDAVAVTLWVAHTHADLERVEQSPILALTSAVKQSGKSRLLDLIHHLVRDPWRVTRPTEAVLFRRIDRDHPTLLLDEVDALFGDKGRATEGIRSLLDSGNRRGTRVPRLIAKGRGFELAEFDVFCPKATAGIGGLPDTVLDRAIVISMERRAPHERVERLRERAARELGGPLREALAQHVGLMEDFTLPDAALPDELDERAQDGWEPLLAIADAAGPRWADRSRAAAVALHRGRARLDDNPGLRLLADCRTIFDELGVSVLQSADLRDALTRIEGSPWADVRGRDMTPHYLAKLLARFGLGTERIRLGTGNPVHCYTRTSFDDIWARYLRSATNGTTDTSDTPSSPATASGDVPVSVVPIVSDQGGNLAAAAWRIFGDEIEWVSGTA
jgi:hypothetical protein